MEHCEFHTKQDGLPIAIRPGCIMYFYPQEKDTVLMLWSGAGVLVKESYAEVLELLRLHGMGV